MNFPTRTHPALATAAALVLTALALGAAEQVDRGLVAIPTSATSVFLSWRVLAADPATQVFNIYRSTDGGEPVKLNEQPMTSGSNFVDGSASLQRANAWWINAVVLPRGGQPQEGAVLGRVELPANPPVRPYLSLPLQGDYSFQKVGIGDLNGDGKLDYVIKQPGTGLDPGTARVSPDTYKVEAYLHDGTFLWRKDLGWNMNMGIWWTPMIVWDFDGDGKAEVALKTAPYAATLGESFAERSGPANGFVISGPEYCSVLDGMTGEEVDKVDWVERGDPTDWGDNRGNRVNRNQIGLASLDGKTTSLLVCRGTYTRMVVDAYTLADGKLRKVWRWDGDLETPRIRGQGCHGMKVGDVDGDGRDEIILGSVALDDDGTVLWNLGMGHPDVMYMTDVIPTRPGFEIAYGYENRQDQNGLCLVDARTGEMIWGHPYKTTHIHDQGMFGDFMPEHPGIEFYAAEQDRTGYWVYSAATGELISDADLGGLSPRAIFWDGGLTRARIPERQFVPGRPSRGPTQILRHDGEVLGEFEGRIIGIGDIVGDWREELIVSVAGELRIYTTTIPTTRRRPSLIEDPLYRKDVALQAMGYLYPPQLSYHFR